LPFTPTDGEPTDLTCGVDWVWYKNLGDFPQSAGWSAVWYLHGPFNLTITSTSGPSDSMYEAEVVAVSTASLVTGDLAVTATWDLWVVNGSEKHALETGTFMVRPNLATPPTAAKTHDELMLDAIRATLLGRATDDVESYQINGRALNRIPAERLVKMEAYYEQRIWRRRHGSAFGGPSIVVNFPGGQ
jgi:hypothetical protein